MWNSLLDSFAEAEEQAGLNARGETASFDGVVEGTARDTDYESWSVGERREELDERGLDVPRKVKSKRKLAALLREDDERPDDSSTLPHETDHAVVVEIRHERLASPEEMILEYLASNVEISNSVVRELTGIGSENTVKRIFKRMIKAGEIEPIPGRSLRAAAYRLPSTGGSTTP